MWQIQITIEEEDCDSSEKKHVMFVSSVKYVVYVRLSKWFQINSVIFALKLALCYNGRNRII